MRLFIAADLPPALEDVLAITSGQLQNSVHGRFVAPDSFHITLAFLGNQDPETVPVISSIIDEACSGRSPFPLTVGAIGHFGRKNHATLWQGFDDCRELAALATDIRHRLNQRDIAFDDKPFACHVTYARSADLTSVDDAKYQISPCISEDGTKNRGIIGSVTLYSSKLEQSGARYTALHTGRFE